MDSCREVYLERFKAKLNELYLNIRDRSYKDPLIAKGLESFMEAGMVLEAVTREELEQVISVQHQAVFGMSRQERLQDLWNEALAKGDYDFFDTPTWQRERK